jgi:hypothetical protein
MNTFAIIRDRMKQIAGIAARTLQKVPAFSFIQL